MLNTKFKSLLSPDERVTGEQLETDRQIFAFDRAVQALSRRKFMGGLSGAMALAVGAGFIEMPKSFGQSAPAITDVLNFALNLEFLEAGLYYFCSTGNPLAGTANGSTLPTTALYQAVKANPGAFALAQALAQDELNHITDLQNAIAQLGGTPISQPVINYAAKGAVTTAAQFLATARQFTAVGNSAYAGAAQYLISNPTVLTVASQILGAEGQHLGAVNFQCIQQGIATALQGSPTASIDALDVPPSLTDYFSVYTSGNTAGQPAGLAPARTTSEVLGDVYGVSTATTTTPTAGVTNGGFFPSGVNGNIKST